MKVNLPKDNRPDFSQAKTGDVYLVGLKNGDVGARLIVQREHSAYHGVDLESGQTTMSAVSPKKLLESYCLGEKITLIPSEKVQVSFL